jgi:ABC-type glycerol-3-phosphate transport system permease component
MRHTAQLKVALLICAGPVLDEHRHCQSLRTQGTIVVAPMIVVGVIVRTWLVTGLTLGAMTDE